MGSSFYAKLAVSNIKKNKSSFIPYIIANIGLMFTFFLFLLLSYAPSMAKLLAGNAVTYVLSMGRWVIGIFSAVFLLYINSFLMKKRKKEFALYGILGLEKGHVALVMFYETFFITISSLVISIISGVIFGKLLYLILLKLMRIESAFHFDITAQPFVITIILFLGLSAVMLFFNFISINLAKPIELLGSDKEGEKEPKAKWFFALIGVVCLGAGYYLSLHTRGQFEAIQYFFVAVLLVIVGTYALFMSGSIALLKILKGRKKFFYKPDNFIAVSGMLYRMKQNAAGLASICIISTMILVIASTTFSLYLGQENIIRERHYYDLEFSMKSGQDMDSVKKNIEEQAKKHKIQIDRYFNTYSGGMLGIYKNGTFQTLDKNNIKQSLLDEDNIYDTTWMTVKEYNREAKKEEQLKEDEILFYKPGEKKLPETITFGEQKFNVKPIEGEFFYTEGKKITFNIKQTAFLIAKDERTLKSIFTEAYGEYPKDAFSYRVSMDFSGSAGNRLNFAKAVKNGLEKGKYYNFENTDINKQDSMLLFGGLIFLGTFLELIFLLAMVLMIYFKQVSEGMDDKKRFIVLQNVGMDKRDVKKTINRQILTVFFLPLAGAVLHVAAAFKMITYVLRGFSLTDKVLFGWCTVGTAVIFSVIYAAVYLLTAKVYYRIVEKKD